MLRSCGLLTALLLAAVLGACGGESEQPRSASATLSITLPPEPQGTVLPGCAAGELESWNEVSGALILTFGSESASALDTAPGDLAPVLNRLAQLRDRVAAQPTPECAATVQNAILAEMRVILDAFQGYANGVLSQADFRARVERANQEIETNISALLAGVQSDLEQQLDAARQSPAPPGG